MSRRIYIEVVDGGFIIETYESALGNGKRVHTDVSKAIEDVRGRLLASVRSFVPCEKKP